MISGSDMEYTRKNANCSMFCYPIDIFSIASPLLGNSDAIQDSGKKKYTNIAIGVLHRQKVCFEYNYYLKFINHIKIDISLNIDLDSFCCRARMGPFIMDINRFVLMLTVFCCGTIRNSVHELKPFQGNLATEIRNERTVRKYEPYFIRNYKNIGSRDDSRPNDNDNGKTMAYVNITNQ